MAAGKYNFVIEQGATTDFQIEYKDGNGDPVDLTYYSGRMSIKSAIGGTDYINLSSSLGPCGTGLNFSGSNGLALITKDKYYLLTDSRYVIQAKNQLPDDCTILNMQNSEEIFTKIFGEISSKFSIGYDPFIFTKRGLEYFLKYYTKGNKYIELLPLENNLIDELWDRDKDFNTKAPLILDVKYTSETENQKINNLISKLKAEYLLITSPESICWLLNIRGSDLKYTPLINPIN